MAKTKSYEDWTYNSKNPLTRFAHRRRTKNSIRAIEMRDGLKLLDFGCGDGRFLNGLAESNGCGVDLTGFEPHMAPMPGNNVKIVMDWDRIEEDVARRGKFDCVTCFEVLEHFSSERQEQAIKKIVGVLKPTGLAVISVPIEVGLPSVVKNIFRRINLPHNKHIYSAANIVRSLFRVPIPLHREQDGYLSHMGFYYQDLEQLLSRYFTVKTKSYSPISQLGASLNSQIFYTLTLASHQ